MLDGCVTLYCRTESGWQRTVLTGVYCENSTAVNRSKEGIKDTARALLVVPCTRIGYVSPAQYTGAQGSWTLCCGDVFVAGDVQQNTPQEAVAAGAQPFLITTVDAKPAAGALAHWEVGGGHLLRRAGGVSA